MLRVREFKTYSKSGLTSSLDQKTQALLQDIKEGRFKKNHWKGKQTSGYRFICPLCSADRRLLLSPNPWQLKYLIRVALTATMVMLAAWPVLGWKGIVSFIPIWTIFEIMYRTQVRAGLICSNCGFDPILFMVDVQKARDEVETHWKARFSKNGIPYPSDEEMDRVRAVARKRGEPVRNVIARRE